MIITIITYTIGFFLYRKIIYYRIIWSRKSAIVNLKALSLRPGARKLIKYIINLHGRTLLELCFDHEIL